MRLGFSPSLVRKFTQRDRMLPAMCRIRTATLFASESSVACSCASDSCSMDLSASFLIFWNSSITADSTGEVSLDMFDNQQDDGYRGQAPRRRGHVPNAAHHGMQHGVENEPPENTLRDGKRQRDQN